MSADGVIRSVPVEIVDEPESFASLVDEFRRTNRTAAFAIVAALLPAIDNVVDAVRTLAEAERVGMDDG